MLEPTNYETDDSILHNGHSIEALSVHDVNC